MTPAPERKLAERIYNGLIPHGAETSREFSDPVDLIESLLKEAMEKAFEKGREQGAFECRHAREIARLEERNRCAKIAESFHGKCCDCFYACAGIAAKIREGN